MGGATALRRSVVGAIKNASANRLQSLLPDHGALIVIGISLLIIDQKMSSSMEGVESDDTHPYSTRKQVSDPDLRLAC